MRIQQRTESLLGDLIAFPTVSSDTNLEMIEYLADRLSDAGARVVLQHREDGKKANLFATIGPECSGGVVLSGHTDVVPVADQHWSSDPFQMRVDGDRLFGRGSCDMKGFIAAAVALAPHFAERATARPVHFAFTYDEEVGCLGAQALVPWLKEQAIQPAMAVIGEPTDMRIVVGHKGCCEYRTRVSGVAGHSSRPDLGISALEYAVRYAGRLLQLRQDLRDRAPVESPFTPPWTTINIGKIQGGVATNVIASKAELEWEMRPVQSSDAAFVKAEMAALCDEQLLPEMQKGNLKASIDLDVIAEVCGLEPVPDNEARALLAHLLADDEAALVAFGTEAGLFQQIGISAVVCGPGSIEQAHKPDEFISRGQLARCLDVLQGVARTLGT